jgi:hypothetical protein
LWDLSVTNRIPKFLTSNGIFYAIGVCIIEIRSMEFIPVMPNGLMAVAWPFFFQCPFSVFLDSSRHFFCFGVHLKVKELLSLN